MKYCTNCGQPGAQGVRFCAYCGTNVSEPFGTVAPLGNFTAPTVARPPKRAGVLALKGFLLSVLLNIVGVFALLEKGHTSNCAAWKAIAFGIGFLYILLSLAKWTRGGERVKGEGIALTVAVLLALICVSALVSSSGGSVAERQNAANPTPPPSTKELLMRDVKLDFDWEKSGFGNIMLANFTIKNPTQFRFKDFEITCNHFSPSGTKIDSNNRTIYEIVGSGATKRIRNMNMGFIHSQASSSSCKITDLVPIL